MLTFIVPAYNELDNIDATILTIHSVADESDMRNYEIMIVDDGSTYGTDTRITGLQRGFPQVSSVRHPTNLGIGSAIRSGLGGARHPQFMVVPGDNDVHPDLLRLLLAFRGQADLILAVPLNKEMRSAGRNAISMLYQLIHFVAFEIFVNYINGAGSSAHRKGALCRSAFAALQHHFRNEREIMTHRLQFRRGARIHASGPQNAPDCHAAQFRRSRPFLHCSDL